MTEKQIRIIINPTSGTRSKLLVQKQIKRLLGGTDFKYELCFTKAAGHATELAQEAAEKKYHAVIAVGGDGTVNETARGLIFTDTILGIIPIGSGNGLGRHLGIPTRLTSAIRSLMTSEVLKIDVCTVNEHAFFNVAGVGYDAVVAHDFATRPGRGFRTYVQTVLDRWFKYKPRKFKISVNDDSYKREALLISVANGSQFGNNAYIAPFARLDDGLMDICILHKFPASAIPIVAYQLFNKEIHRSKYSEFIQASEFRIKQKGKKIHLDGEPYKLGKKLHFKVLPLALNIFAPKYFVDEFRTEHTIHRSE